MGLDEQVVVQDHLLSLRGAEFLEERAEERAGLREPLVPGDGLHDRLHVGDAPHRDGRLRKCHEFETDLGDIAVRQPRNRRSQKINMSHKLRPYTAATTPRDL